MTTVAKAIKQQIQPSFCLFPPVAESLSPSLLHFKLRRQLHMQGYLVPLAPITSEQTVNEQVTHWTPSYIEDVFYIEMCEAEIADPNNPDEKISRYYLEAGKYAG